MGDVAHGCSVHCPGESDWPRAGRGCFMCVCTDQPYKYFIIIYFVCVTGRNVLAWVCFFHWVSEDEEFTRMAAQERSHWLGWAFLFYFNHMTKRPFIGWVVFSLLLLLLLLF